MLGSLMSYLRNCCDKTLSVNFSFEILPKIGTSIDSTIVIVDLFTRANGAVATTKQIESQLILF